MKIKAYMSLMLAVILTGTAIGAYAAGSGSAAEIEDSVKPMIYSAAYENYLPPTWYTAEKMKASLTRKDAAYLAVHTLAKATGKSPDWIDYKTELNDTDDPMLSRAIDLGLMSADQNLNFNENKPVTHQEMAVMITKIAQRLNVYKKPTVKLAYKDQKSIADWAKESVQYVAQNKWAVWVKDSKFEPTKAITLGRAVALTDQFLVVNGVYPGAANLKSSKTYDVKGFKVPMPTDTELEVTVTPEGNLKIYFTGTIKNRSAYTYKKIEQQLIEILDSNAKVSFTARIALVAAIQKAWDSTTQTYNFSTDQYIRLDNGQISPVKPNGAAMSVKAGKALHIEIIQ